MTTIDDRPVQLVPAREIPVPTSVSTEAQAMPAGGVIGATEYPARTDRRG